LIKFPELSDKEIAQELDINESSYSAAKNRLLDIGVFRKINIPVINRFGYELMGINYTNFIFGLSIEERLKMTTKRFEKKNEIFLSVGDNEKGFSVNFCKNYTQFVKINNDRTKTFGELNILGRGHPKGVVFPFQTAKIYRFFDYGKLIASKFKINTKENGGKFQNFFQPGEYISLTDKEKEIFSILLQQPTLNNQEIAQITQTHRHTVSNVRHKLKEQRLMRKIVLPNLEILGFKLLVFYNLQYNAREPPTKRDLEIIINDNVVFFAHNPYESVILSVYDSFPSYLNHRSMMIEFLEENHILSNANEIYEYSIDSIRYIKDFQFLDLF
jgi:DNA-binding CsgD family transcriptional regulator